VALKRAGVTLKRKSVALKKPVVEKRKKSTAAAAFAVVLRIFL